MSAGITGHQDLGDADAIRWATEPPLLVPMLDLAQAVRDRVVADFEGADTDDAKFNEGLRRVIAALKESDPPKPTPTT